MAPQQSTAIDSDELAREKIREIEKLLELSHNCQLASVDSWLLILKKIITAADLHRTNEKKNQPDSIGRDQDAPESIYADFADDNEQFNVVDLTEQFATNSVKWTIRVHAFKIVHRLIKMLTDDQLSSRSRTPPVLKHLPDLVRLSFVAATSPYDDLKMQGFEMFRFVITKFSSVQEKEFPGHSILEQYKTQIVSALKPAFNMDAPPYITAIACQICGLWICKGLENDPVDLVRLHRLMQVSLEKLENQWVNQNNKLYTESELEQERVDVLGAWAQLYVTSKETELNKVPERNQKHLESLIQSNLGTLIGKWWEALKDYALLIMPAPKYIGSSHDNGHVYTRDIALKLFEPTWYKIVLALTLWLCSDRPEKDPNSAQPEDQSNCDNEPATSKKMKYAKFISGVIMKELCTWQADPKVGVLSESIVNSLRALRLILADKNLRSVFEENSSVTYEFYITVFCITIHNSRENCRALLLECTNALFRLLSRDIVENNEHALHGAARMIDNVNKVALDLKGSVARKAPQAEAQKVVLLIRLQCLLELARSNVTKISVESRLCDSICLMLLDVMDFNGLSKLTDQYDMLIKESFTDRLSADVRHKYELALEKNQMDKTKVEPKKKVEEASKKPVVAKQRTAKITLKTDFSNFCADKPKNFSNKTIV